MERLSFKKRVQKWLKSSLEDPVVKILLKNGNMTKKQLETLLIDLLAENVAQKRLKYEEKGRLRLEKAGISRGAFNRTLRQARTNIIRAIYTVFLLGYLGVFDTTQLDPYLEVGNKLQRYMNAYREILDDEEVPSEHLRVMNMLREELRVSLDRLSRQRSMK